MTRLHAPGRPAHTAPPAEPAPAPEIPWFVLPAEEVAARLGVDPAVGLSAEEAPRRLAEHGPNELQETRGRGPLAILAEQVSEPLTLVLVMAAAVAAAIWWLEADGPEALPYDSLVILAIVVLNTALGFIQEYRAEQAVAALKRMTAPESTVRRDGQIRRIPAREVVPGDLLLLEAGDRVPADARLLHTVNLEVDEAPLTGESVPVRKHTRPLDDPRTEIGDQVNMVFMGTVVTYGRGEAVVVATGMATAMGRIAHLLQTTEDQETPLQRDLARVGRQLGMAVLAIAAVVTLAGILRARELTLEVALDMFLFGVALAVAAIPEGLPAVVTVVLALGMRRMAERNAIVRRLPAVETLGSATVICSDKTGTLTRNEMTVVEILLGVDRVVHVEGEGYLPQGRFLTDQGPLSPEQDPDLRWLARIAGLNNDARLMQTEEGRWQVVGDPTEGALLVLACKAGVDPDRLREEFPRVGEIPFSSERKRMTTVHTMDGAQVAVVKGAPEVLLERCDRVRDHGTVRPMEDRDREAIRARNEAFAARALRTLALASRVLEDDHPISEDRDPETVERGLIWEGLVGMIDPPRPEARSAVQMAQRAGIRTLMITGDHRLTALAIAQDLGIAGPQDRVITGAELSAMDAETLEAVVQEVSVYARVNPEHKLRLVEALKAHGHVVAMTGDGVNDAPALRRADIGVAMGITGTEVSKEAADMVLTDDNYATIVAAVAEGRTILDNITKFLRYLLSSNMGEVMTMFSAMVLAGILALTVDGRAFLPLLAVQILWINLVTDGGPALAMGVDPPEPDVMERPPRPLHAPIIDRTMWAFILMAGAVMALGSLFVLDSYLPGGWTDWRVPGPDREVDLVHARTVVFTVLVLFQLVNAFNCRSGWRSVLRMEYSTNPWLWGAVLVSLALHMAVIYWRPLQRAFDTVPLDLADWLVAVAVALTLLLAAEVFKVQVRRQRARPRAP